MIEKICRHTAESTHHNPFNKNKNCLWWPCFLSNRDEMRISSRGPAFYNISLYLAIRFQRRRFLEINQPRNKNCLATPCLLTDRDEMSILYRWPSIGASYKVSVLLAKWFQRRRFKCEKLTDRRRNDKWWWSLWYDDLFCIMMFVYSVN